MPRDRAKMPFSLREIRHEKYGKVKINPKKTGDGGCDLFSDVLDDFNDVKKRYYFQAKLRNPDGPVVGPEVLNALI